MKKSFYFTLIFLITCSAFTQKNEYNILDFGAIGNGQHINTIAIQNAIDQAYKEGGGIVIIPKGEFLSGSLRLKSKVSIYLNDSAILLGSTNPKDYFKLNRWFALLLSDSATNIGIKGKGVVDGQGDILALKIDSLFYEGEIDSANYELKEKRPKVTIRPQIIEFVNSKNIKVEGITIKNGASWVQSYYMCNNLLIDKIRVESDTYWNNDGVDIIDCKNVIITNSYFNSSDDGICIKSYGRERHGSPFCDSIFIKNCTVRSSASAVKLGTASFGGFKNVTIRNIKVYDTFRSAIALESYGNGFLENILIENIEAKNTGNAFFIRIGQVREDLPAGKINNVKISNMNVEIAGDIPDKKYKIRGPSLPFFHNTFPSSITGLSIQKVENIFLKNITISYPGKAYRAYANLPTSRLSDVPEYPEKYPEYSMFGELPAWGIYLRHTDGIELNNVKLILNDFDYRPSIVFDDVKNIRIKSLTIKGDSTEESFFLKDSELLD